MKFGLLGSIEVRHEERVLSVGSGRERLVLATLLLNAGRLTPADGLIHALWNKPPLTAKAQLHNMISNLRRRLRVGDADLIVTRPMGYELHLGAHELDVVQFRRLAERGRQAAASGDHSLAVAQFTEALSLWRGPPLVDVADELVGEARQTLAEEKLAVAQARLDVELALGLYDTVLGELSELIAEHRYRERLYELEMLALVGAGRRADALATYRRVYRLFADDLGVEPGSSLRDLERWILSGEVLNPVRAKCRELPRQLPSVTAALTGRDELIGKICGELRCSTKPMGSVVVLVGPGGVGKTTLALAVAHRLGAEFPDGQLYADLRGIHGIRADPHAVVGRFLRALGLDGARLPDDPDERGALFRSQLAGRRMLIVLDDALSEEQVRPLLSADGGCGVLVTSRRRLGALVGAARWTVPVLAPVDALQLFAQVVGAERAGGEPEAATAIVELCGYLPLAVCVAAARLSVRPEWTLEKFRQRLAEKRGGLDELAVGDLDVRASIALSYQSLAPPLRQLFRRLGLSNAPEWPSWVTHELVDQSSVAQIGWMLDELAEVHLIEPLGYDAVGQARFRLHNLIGDFAHERALAEDEPEERAAVLARLLSGWLGLATEADEQIPYDLIRAPDMDIPSPLPSTASLARNMPIDWFETERRNLVFAIDHACRLELPDIAGALALRLSGFLGLRSYGDDWESTLRRAISCVRKHDSGRLLVRLLAALFTACLRCDRYAELPIIAEEELSLARDLHDRELEVCALTHAGLAAGTFCRFDEAIDWYEQAVCAAREPDVDLSLLRRSLDCLALTNMTIGHPKRALPLFEEALDVDRESRTALQTSLHLYHYGMVLTALGRLADAERQLAQALQTNRELDHDHGAAYLEQALADVDIRQDRLSVAAKRLDRARQAHEKIGSGDGLAQTLRSTGDLAAAEGRWADAITCMRQALEIWRRIESQLEIARTLARLERVHTTLGDQEAAESCRRECRTILTDLKLDRACLYLPPFLIG